MKQAEMQDQYPEKWRADESGELPQSDPFAAPNALSRAVVPERDLSSRHRHIFENDDVGNCWGD